MRFKPVRAALAALLFAGTGCHNGQADQEILHITGSSTVWPFAARVAEQVKDETGIAAVVEASGSANGHRALCTGQADIAVSSRLQKPGETAFCRNAGVTDLSAIKIGYDGIIIGVSAQADAKSLTLSDLFLALAKTIPDPAQGCALMPNPHKLWSDVRADLPPTPIRIFGPSPSSGTRDAFADLAMTPGAQAQPCMARLKSDTPDSFTKLTHTLRTDGVWIDTGENDDGLVRSLITEPDAIGIFGFSFLRRNPGTVKGLTLNNVSPTAETIADGTYPLSRPLWMYVRTHASERREAGMAFITEFLSDAASGTGGYLDDAGLVPLPPDERSETDNRLKILSGRQHGHRK